MTVYKMKKYKRKYPLSCVPLLDFLSLVKPEKEVLLKDVETPIGSIYNQVKIVNGIIVGIEASFILKEKKDGKDNWEKIE